MVPARPYDANFYEFAWALDRHQRLLDDFVPQTFVGNHDVTRIASQLNDPRLLAPAVALLLMLPGVPSIYAGDEQGMAGVKQDRAGGDDAVRPAFPDRPQPLTTAADDVLRLHRELIGLRRRHPWLVRTRATVEHLANQQLLLRMSDGGTALVLALNLAAAETLPLPDGQWQVVAGQGERTDGGVILGEHDWCVLSSDA